MYLISDHAGTSCSYPLLECTCVLDGLSHGLGIGCSSHESLLAGSRFACFFCFDGCIGVEVGWEADVYRVLQERVDVGVFPGD